MAELAHLLAQERVFRQQPVQVALVDGPSRWLSTLRRMVAVHLPPLSSVILPNARPPPGSASAWPLSSLIISTPPLATIWSVSPGALETQLDCQGRD